MRTVKKLLTMLLALCLVVGSIGVLPAKASTGVDVTSSVSLEAWGDQAELKFTNLFLGAGVLPSFAYDAMDKETYMYVQEYIAINGQTVKDINTNTDTSGYEFTIFPSTIGAPYNVPVILFQDGENITIKIHGTYLATLDDISITVKAGLSFVNGDTTYTVGEDVTFNLVEGIWVKQMSEVDITDLTALNDWGSQAELQFANLTFGEGILTAFGYGAIDGNYTYLQNYLTINGETVADINANTDVSGYEFTVFPSTNGTPYNVPIMLFQDGKNLTIKIHSTYLAGVENVTIGVKAGFYIENGAKKYCVNDDVNFALVDGAWVLQKDVVDISDVLRVAEWNAQENLQYAQLSFGEGVLPAFGYGVHDGDYAYLQEYITVNGRTVADINANTDVSGYEFTVFPSTNGAPYNVPIILYQDGDYLTIKIHNSYLAADAGVEIGILANAYFDVARTVYKVTESRLFHWTAEGWVEGHKEIEIPGKAATCKEYGATAGVACEICHKVLVEQEMIGTVKHKEVIIPGKAAQVGKTGLTEGKKCSVCGDVIVPQKTIAAKTLAKPAASKITKVTKGKKQLTVKFKKVSSVTRYEIRIATKSNMKKILKTYKVTKSKDMKAGKYVVKSLKAKTTYYLQIRTVKTVNGVTKTSSWSKAVKGKTK